MATSGGSMDQVVPVFVSPTTLTFVASSVASHRQILTIYNPYTYSIQFKIYSTSADRYLVIEPEGLIMAKNRVDIVIRHRSVEESLKSSSTSFGDRMRIKIAAPGNDMIRGSLDVPVRLLRNNESEPPSIDQSAFTAVSSRHLSASTLQQDHYAAPDSSTAAQHPPNPPQPASITIFFIFLSIICFGCLLIRCDSVLSVHSSLPSIVVTKEHHYVAAYILGLLTSLFLRL